MKLLLAIPIALFLHQDDCATRLYTDSIQCLSQNGVVIYAANNVWIVNENGHFVVREKNGRVITVSGQCVVTSNRSVVPEPTVETEKQ